MKQGMIVLLKLVVSLTLLYIIFRRVDAALVWETLTAIQPVFLVGSLVLYGSIQVLAAYRWFLLLPEGGMGLAFSRMASLYYIGLFFNQFLPTAIGGDAVKAYYFYRLSGEASKGIASIFMDRYTGFLTLVLIALVSLLLGYSYVQASVVPGIILLLAAAFLTFSLFLWVKDLHDWAVRWTRRIGAYGINERVESLYRAVMLYRGRPQVLIKALTISLLLHGAGILVVYLLSLGLGFSVPIGYFFLFVPLGISISMLPISIAGLGLREGAFVYLFSRADLKPAEALSLSLSWFFVALLVGLIGGIEYARIGGMRKDGVGK